MTQIPDNSPAIGPEWQRTRTAYTAITDRITDLAIATRQRKSPEVRAYFMECDRALTEMQQAAHAYRDAMATVAAERDAFQDKLDTIDMLIADPLTNEWTLREKIRDAIATPAPQTLREGEG